MSLKGVAHLPVTIGTATHLSGDFAVKQCHRDPFCLSASLYKPCNAITLCGMKVISRSAPNLPFSFFPSYFEFRPVGGAS